jgi:hypothetical protein
MKKKNYLLMLAFFATTLLTFSTSCKKKGCMDKYADNYSSKVEKDDGSCSYSKGSLLVRAVDAENNPLNGDEIWIYNNQTDFNNDTNPISKQTADSKGEAIFTNLTPGKYWADCMFTDTNNDTQFAEGSGTVSLGMQTTITIKP